MTSTPSLSAPNWNNIINSITSSSSPISLNSNSNIPNPDGDLHLTPEPRKYGSRSHFIDDNKEENNENENENNNNNKEQVNKNKKRDSIKNVKIGQTKMHPYRVYNEANIYANNGPESSIKSVNSISSAVRSIDSFDTTSNSYNPLPQNYGNYQPKKMTTCTAHSNINNIHIKLTPTTSPYICEGFKYKYIIIHDIIKYTYATVPFVVVPATTHVINYKINDKYISNAIICGGCDYKSNLSLNKCIYSPITKYDIDLYSLDIQLYDLYHVINHKYIIGTFINNKFILCAFDCGECGECDGDGLIISYICIVYKGVIIKTKLYFKLLNILNKHAIDSGAFDYKHNLLLHSLNKYINAPIEKCDNDMIQLSYSINDKYFLSEFDGDECNNKFICDGFKYKYRMVEKVPACLCNNLERN